MRTLFWILLLANVILFALMQGGVLSGSEQAYQALPPLHEEKIRLLGAPSGSAQDTVVPAPAPSTVAAPLGVTAQAAPPAPIAAPASAPSPVSAPAASPASAPVAPAPEIKPAPAIKPNRLVCLEWGDFSGSDLKRATEILSGMQLGDRLNQRQIEYSKGYWVYIPPLKNKSAANRRVSQLKKLGIKEYFIVQDAGALRYAISLGVFKTQEAALNHLNELKAKGVRSARIGERASKLKTIMFVLSEVDSSIEGKLTAVKKDFPGSELKSVACALTK